MSFIKMLINLALIIVVLVFAFMNNDLATFKVWPFGIEITISLSVAVVFLIFMGFLWGKFDSWVSHAPLRKALRDQKKQNKKLNKEQEKLTKEVVGLHENINTLKTQEKQNPKPGLGARISAFFKPKAKE